MAAKQHLELFFERFLSFNLDRYQSNPTYLALFTDLTFADVTISAIVKTDGDTRRSSTVTSVSRNFRGINQSWTPAPAATDLELYTLKNTEALADLNALEAQTEAGLYSYVDGPDVKVGIVIAAGIEEAGIPAAVEAMLRANLKYDIPTVTVAPGGTTAVLVGDTFEGTLEWVAGTAPVVIIPETDYGQLDAENV
jgi:hypothetical protein